MLLLSELDCGLLRVEGYDGLSQEPIDRLLRVYDVGLLALLRILDLDLLGDPHALVDNLGAFTRDNGLIHSLALRTLKIRRPSLHHLIFPLHLGHQSLGVNLHGRPDLAGARVLAQVDCPTLLLVGSLDEEVLALNRQAALLMQCDVHLTVVPGATHLFEEPGTLETVARHAAQWFERHLRTKH